MSILISLSFCFLIGSITPFLHKKETKKIFFVSFSLHYFILCQFCVLFVLLKELTCKKKFIMCKISPIFNTFKVDDKKQININNIDSKSIGTYDIPSKNYSNSFNKYLINFKGLNRVLSKRAYNTPQEIKALMVKYASSEGIVGNIPAEWIGKIPKEERKIKIKKLCSDFKTAVKNFRKTPIKSELALRLRDALHKAGVIDEGENLALFFLDEGAFGSGFQLKNILGDKYMIKIFHKEDFLNRGNGNYTELNRAAYWQKNAGKKTQRARFYLGDMDAGYMISKFISRTTPEFKKEEIKEEIYGLSDYETNIMDNYIRGYQVDYGNLYIGSSILSQNKTARYVYKKLSNCPKEDQLLEVDKFLNMKKFKNNADIKLGLIESLELLPEELIFKIFDTLREGANDMQKEALNRVIEHLGLTSKINNQLRPNAILL